MIDTRKNLNWMSLRFTPFKALRLNQYLDKIAALPEWLQNSTLETRSGRPCAI